MFGRCGCRLQAVGGIGVKPLRAGLRFAPLRCAGVKTSAIGARASVGGDLETARGFVVLVRVHPVVEARPLGVAGVEFFPSFAWRQIRKLLRGLTAAPVVLEQLCGHLMVDPPNHLDWTL